VSAGLTHAHAIRRQPLSVVIDQHRHHGGAAGKRRYPTDVVDAVLQDGDPRRGRAQEHPVDRLGLFRLAKDGKRQFNHTARPIEREPADRPTHAGNDVVAACRRQASGGPAADATDADHGDAKTALR
jgi:hypothetical protein